MVNKQGCLQDDVLRPTWDRLLGHAYTQVGGRMAHDYRDIGGRVTPGAVNEDARAENGARL